MPSRRNGTGFAVSFTLDGGRKLKLIANLSGEKTALPGIEVAAPFFVHPHEAAPALAHGSLPPFSVAASIESGR
jgi:hypothetical protein